MMKILCKQLKRGGILGLRGIKCIELWKNLKFSGLVKFKYLYRQKYGRISDKVKKKRAELNDIQEKLQGDFLNDLFI